MFALGSKRLFNASPSGFVARGLLLRRGPLGRVGAAEATGVDANVGAGNSLIKQETYMG